MNSSKDFNNYMEVPGGSDAGEPLSVDDFIKELEAKEKDLCISPDLTIEIDDLDIADEVPDFMMDELRAGAPRRPDLGRTFERSIEVSEVSRLEQALSDLQVQVSRKENERIELAETLRRRQTDFDNYRKRIERDRGEAFVGQISNLAKQMLPVLDNLDRALDFAANHSANNSQDFTQFYEGIVMVNQQLNEVMAEMGVQPIAAIGQAFDPNFHEAVAADDSGEFPANTITGELLRGYRIGDRIVRPAMVRVALQPKSAQAAETVAEPDVLPPQNPADNE